MHRCLECNEQTVALIRAVPCVEDVRQLLVCGLANTVQSASGTGKVWQVAVAAELEKGQEAMEEGEELDKRRR